MLGIFAGILKYENGDTETARLAGYFSNDTPEFVLSHLIVQHEKQKPPQSWQIGNFCLHLFLTSPDYRQQKKGIAPICQCTQLQYPLA